MGNFDVKTDFNDGLIVGRFVRPVGILVSNINMSNVLMGTWIFLDDPFVAFADWRRSFGHKNYFFSNASALFLSMHILSGSFADRRVDSSWICDTFFLSVIYCFQV